MSNKTPIKPTWVFPWRYTESFIIAFSMILMGFGLELFTPGKITAPSYPNNIFAGLFFLFLNTFIYIKWKKHPIVRWFYSIEAATAAIVAFLFVAALLGIFPQGEFENGIWSRLGLHHVMQSWPYLLTFILLTNVLGVVSVHRAIPFKRKNIGFLLNHLGLWITLMAATLGTGDLQRLNMYVYEDKGFEWRAVDKNDTMHELPLAVKLKNFEIEEYAPKIALVNKITGHLLGEKNKNLFTTEKGTTMAIEFVEISVHEFLPSSLPTPDAYAENNTDGAAPAALITVTDTRSNTTHKKWISCGSYKHKGQYVALDSTYAVAMLQAEPKRYYSEVEIVTPDKQNYKTTIEVNKPFKINGWKLYQISYEEAMGRWSNLSVLEAVRDPWLPVVYTGIFMLIAGSIFIFWMGKSMKQTSPAQLKNSVTHKKN